MKRLIFTALMAAAATGVFAQTKTDTIKTDNSTKVVKTNTLKVTTIKNGSRIDSVKTTKTTLTLSEGKVVDSVQESNTTISRKPTFSVNFGGKRDSTRKKVSKAPGFSWGLTFSRFDLGLATMIDNGSTRLSPTNEFLRYRSWKSSNVGFDVFQAGYRFNSTFKMYMATGFDWELFRLREDITITRTPDMSGLKYTQDNVDYKKNRFSSAYLRIPVMFDFRSNDDKGGDRWHYVFGPEFGVLLTGRVKQISDEYGKQKMNYPYHFTKFRYGAVARVGHGGFGLFAKYYFNDMFDTEAQRGLKNMNVGLTVGF
ncbi:outer membrane beta-barrel protein [Mucilaginibacter myungsuensis]|uniref:Outer membrane beta-barrel protein n=1 Tax=Mucilaginibacter myungsuensis TaxID=649104 RepID=A0A929PXQ6_9SPHI|nr:outer membrane beta-barrel protein [Mucilaginibacter myungsuensis]MBE9662512.1 outer membrane beta-barrel protein [Mucilaginibacter myungsuensis]MDN3597931.1 outer membrane beta-barrel protein [Mucilaginibacter myungsuensis]